MKKLFVIMLSLFSIFSYWHSPVYGDNSSDLQGLIEDASFDSLILTSHPIDADFDQIKKKLFEKLTARSAADSARFKEHQRSELQYQDKKMRYTMTKIGSPSPEGYPLYIALHGGGGGPSWVNDSQWDHMKYYYKSSIKNGIYIAPRGVTDTWNLHFIDESYSLYEKMIENMILFENVDPSRIYILGFSAGGDGVYQIAARMADRFAGANMSAGHSNGTDLANLKNTHFLMQMGEMDGSYNRNKNVVENHLQLQKLKELHGGYHHEIFLHYSGSHNSWSDNDPNGSERPVLKDPEGWLNNGRKEVVYKNTNAVHWLRVHARDSFPQELVWNTAITSPDGKACSLGVLETAEAKETLGSYRRLFYWLDVNNNPKDKPLGKIIASYEKSRNQVVVKQIEQGVNVTILLNNEMVDFTKPVTVIVKGETVGEILLKPDVKIMARTFLERGDPNYCFSAEIKLESDPFGKWRL